MEYECIKRVYDKLQDDVSRDIFEKRLLYSLSGNDSHIDSLVLNEMERLGSSDLMNKCIAWVNGRQAKQISVFGAGFAGYQIIHIIRLLGISVLRIYDNDSSRWGSYHNNIKICSPDDITDEEIIILGVNYHREEILEQISKRCNVQNIFIPDSLWWLGKYPQYFDKDILEHSNSEVFIDGGSLDGGDSLNFVEWCSSQYKHIFAFEPDCNNVTKLDSVSEKIENFEVYPVGMWSEKATLRFSSGQSENCAISEDGNIIIEVDSIDNTLKGHEATFIKMDIEGSELQALTGAENTIKKYKPKLAICVYHKPEDIIEIPMKILELNPNYKLWLRHYSYVDTETVLYAVDGKVTS